MKKVISGKAFFFLAVCLLTVSCGKDEVTISKEEYNELKGVSGSQYPKPFKLLDQEMSYSNRDGIVLGSDMHEYLITNWGSNAQNVEHYIDCDFCKSREKELKQSVNGK